MDQTDASLHPYRYNRYPPPDGASPSSERVRDSPGAGNPCDPRYMWRKAWRLRGGVVPASKMDPQDWGLAVKFAVLRETAGLNATELGAYCRDRGLFPGS